MIKHKLLLFQARTKKNPHRLLAILLDGTYPWYLTRASTSKNIALEIFNHFVLSKFNIILNDFTSFITSNQNKFDYIALSDRLMLSDFSFIVTTKYQTANGNTNTLILIRKQITKEKDTEFYSSRKLEFNTDGVILINKYGFDRIEILEFIDLFNGMI